jgi:cytochrome c oxidase subunit IV
MVASVFMHLSHEKKWIYGALLLTVLGFIILMTVPIFTVNDSIGTPIHAGAAAEHAEPRH